MICHQRAPAIASGTTYGTPAGFPQGTAVVTLPNEMEYHLGCSFSTAPTLDYWFAWPVNMRFYATVRAGNRDLRAPSVETGTSISH